MRKACRRPKDEGRLVYRANRPEAMHSICACNGKARCQETFLPVCTRCQTAFVALLVAAYNAWQLSNCRPPVGAMMSRKDPHAVLSVRPKVAELAFQLFGR